MRVTVVNTGGTFNKRYNPLNGALEVPSDNNSLEKIIEVCHNIEFELINIVSKDSLDMTDVDREQICEAVKKAQSDKVIIIHGTDTVHLTSALIKSQNIEKKIVFTGAMIPMSIDVVEATMNFSLALGFLSSLVENGTYISMHGVVADCSKLIKNRELGQFLIKES